MGYTSGNTTLTRTSNIDELTQGKIPFPIIQMYSFLRLLYFTFDTSTGIVVFHNVPPSLDIIFNSTLGELSITETNFVGIEQRFNYIGRRGVLTFEGLTLANLCECCPQDAPFTPTPEQLEGFDYDFNIEKLL